jgi:hypothetical protein
MRKPLTPEHKEKVRQAALKREAHQRLTQMLSRPASAADQQPARPAGELSEIILTQMPVSTSPPSSIDAKKLAYLSASPENTLHAVSCALNVSGAIIEEFIKTNYGQTWAEYHLQQVTAAKALAEASVTARRA